MLNSLQPTAKHFSSHLNTTWTWQIQCVSKHRSFNTQSQSHTLCLNFCVWLLRQFFSFVLCYRGSWLGDIKSQEPWVGAQKWFEDARKKGIFNWNNVIVCPSGAGNKIVTPSSHSLVRLLVKVLSYWVFCSSAHSLVVGVRCTWLWLLVCIMIDVNLYIVDRHSILYLYLEIKVLHKYNTQHSKYEIGLLNVIWSPHSVADDFCLSSYKAL